MPQQPRRSAPGRCIATGAGIVTLFTAFVACGIDPPAAVDESPAPLECNENSTLVESGSQVSCRCKTGYTGLTCAACVEGYGHNSSGKCVLRDCTHGGKYACAHGRCGWNTPNPACTCDEGYDGPTCSECASGFNDDAVPGTCEPDHCVHGDANYCGDHGTCDSQGCQCDEGHAGKRCEICADGFLRNKIDGECYLTCALGKYTCDHHGTCVEDDNGPVCECAAGYQEVDRFRCAPTQGTRCDDPIDFDLADRFVESTTVGGGPTIAASCIGNINAAARVYRLTLAKPETVRIHAGGMGYLSVSGDCASTAAEIACSQYPHPNDVLEAALPAGESFIVVQDNQIFGNSFPSHFGFSVEVVCPEGERFDVATQGCLPDACSPNLCAQANQHQCQASPSGSFSCTCDPGSVETTVAGLTACTANLAAKGSSCDTVLSLPLGQGQTVTLNEADAIESNASTCSHSESGRALYYSFYLSERSRVRFYARSKTDKNLSVSLRRQCASRASELSCQHDGGLFGLGDGPAFTGGLLDPGTYFAVVDGILPSASATLDYSIFPDPCASLPACPEAQERIPTADWSTCSCGCPDGFVVDGDSCVADPCASNPCSGTPTTRCIVDTGASYHCECPVGMVDGPSPGEACISDPAAAEWTVLVYESLNNNLGAVMANGPTLLGNAIDTTTPMHVVWLNAIPGNQTTLFHVGHGSPLEEVSSWQTPNMGDWRTLREFGALAAQYPAHHYALVIVDHGGDLQASWDTAYNNMSISVPTGDYARALAAVTQRIGRPLDVVQFATCLMATWEVAEATRPYGRSLLGSPVVTYGNAGAWLAKALAQDPFQPLVDVGHQVANQMGASGNVQSWTDLSNFQTVVNALNSLTNEMITHPDLCLAYDAAAMSSHVHLDAYGADPGTFATHLAANTTLPQAIRAKATAFSVALTTAVYAFPAETSGLSIYLPPLVLPAGTSQEQRALNPDYSSAPGAVWAANSTWDELITMCRQQ